VTPDDLIRAAPAIAKGAGALAAAIPFTGIVKRMLGPAADELAEMWRDQVRLYRYERQLKCVEKAERMAQEAGFTPQAVPPKILFPLLEGASFEENEDLHTMWAALLANAASPIEDIVRPGFIATLRQLSADEASFLDWIYSHIHELSTDQDFYHPIGLTRLRIAYTELGLGEMDSRFGVCLNSLEAEKLVERRFDLADVERSEKYGIDRIEPYYSLTYRGHLFVAACRAPSRT
jgi:hypothetical protein